jgi:hypothetical protein
MAAKASAKPMRVLKTSDADFQVGWKQVCQRRVDSVESVDKEAKKIVERVRDGGDKELLACVRKFDGAKLKALEVVRDEWDEGCDRVDPADRAALGKAAMRVREFHRKRIPSSWEMREEGGAYMGQRVRPLQRVGLYAPGGKAIYPSTVIMNATPASVVEVPEICLATPPGSDGSIRPEVLMAARVAGVHRVFKMGGAHAVAAFAYGTESVPQVDKIVQTIETHGRRTAVAGGRFEQGAAKQRTVVAGAADICGHQPGTFVQGQDHHRVRNRRSDDIDRHSGHVRPHAVRKSPVRETVQPCVIISRRVVERTVGIQFQNAVGDIILQHGRQSPKAITAII